MTPAPALTRACPRCGTTTPIHFVACPKCFTLFFAAELTALSSEADALEREGDPVGALAKLRAMEPMLPGSSTQAAQLKARITALEAKAGTAGVKRKPGQRGWLAGAGAVLVAVLSKAKFLLIGLAKLPTLLTFFLSASLWGGSSGLALGLVVLGSIYVHEMGHTFAFRRYGIEVTPPMFVPGFGAFVRGTHYPKSPSAIGDVALSGPVWGGVSGVLTLLLGVLLHQEWLAGAAVLIAEINLFNLIPVWQLDGSRAAAVLSRGQLLALGAAGLALGVVAGSPMAMISGAGLMARRWVGAPAEAQTGDRRTLVLFAVLVAGLLGLRLVANLFVQPAS